jgi:hypothetical protein
MIRRALLLCLVLAVAGAVAGCGGQGASDEGSANGGASDGAGEQAQAEGGEAAGEAGEEAGSEEGGGEELSRVDASSPVYGSSYVSPLVEIFGDVRIGEGAIIAGPAPEGEGDDLPLRIPEGTNIPAGAIITSQEDLDELCGLIDCPGG